MCKYSLLVQWPVQALIALHPLWCIWLKVHPMLGDAWRIPVRLKPAIKVLQVGKAVGKLEIAANPILYLGA